MTKRINVLVVEDDPDYAELTGLLLAEASGQGVAFVPRACERLSEALAALDGGGLDAVLLDLMLPDCRGLETVARVRRAFRHAPIVVLTSLYDENLAVEAVRLGAQDYLVKSQFNTQVLRRTICYAVERARLTAELEKAEAAKAELRERRRVEALKEKFGHAVNHELRSPLTIIKAALASLRDGLAEPLEPKQRELVEVADRSADRMKRILGGLLELARLESGRAQVASRRVDAGALLRETAQGFALLCAQKGLALELELDGGLPELKADPDLLVQVLSNLLDNALRFARRRIVVRALAPPGAETVEFQVSDDGPGVPAGRVGQLFDKFVQLTRPPGPEEYKGTGLGLALCKEMVERQGGRIWVESREGEGARFRFTLPRFEPASTATANHGERGGRGEARRNGES